MTNTENEGRMDNGDAPESDMEKRRAISYLDLWERQVCYKALHMNLTDRKAR